MIYTARQIQERDTDCEKDKGVWIPARPINHACDTWMERCHHAWGVLVGRYDAVDWQDRAIESNGEE